MAKKTPGLYDRFKGLWVRGNVDNVPPDHFSDDLNNMFKSSPVQGRDGTSIFLDQSLIVRTALYKPNPPFVGTNIPRMIYLRSDGNLFDSNYPNNALYGNVAMTDFALVNFFGRAYISPSDGRVGLDNEFNYVYDGTGPSGFRKSAGIAPTVALTGHVQLGSIGAFNFFVGTHLFSYAFETASGFITRPAPFLALDTLGGGLVTFDTIPLGGPGIVARWIIGTQGIPLRADLTIPFDVTTANFYPQFLVQRIGDNTTTSLADFAYYDESLIESSDYLQTLLDEIPASVGLMDFKGRMILYGEHDNPSVVRGSIPGEPETISETSGFFIVDPSDSTGVRSATEFRNILYFYKQQRGYMTQDNGEELSTWDVVNFEKSIGTEQYGIAAVLDAKGSSSEGYIVASRGAIVYFNGVFVEPELSYKIRDLWSRVNPTYFYKMQLANDPITKQLFALVPLNDIDEDGNVIVERITCSHIIYGDYRDGLDPMNIKWSLWQFAKPPVSILIYNEFTNEIPSLVTRFANNTNVVTLTKTSKTDNGELIDSYFELSPLRWSSGISQYTEVRIRAIGPCRLSVTAYGEDLVEFTTTLDISVSTSAPGREYSELMNLVSEQCRLKIRAAVLNQRYNVNAVQVMGAPLWSNRVR